MLYKYISTCIFLFIFSIFYSTTHKLPITIPITIHLCSIQFSLPILLCQIQSVSFNITHAQQYLDSFQAPLCWNGKIRSILIKLGFSLNESDYGIYSQKLGRGLVLLASASSAKAESAKNKLASIFKMKNIGSASYFL